MIEEQDEIDESVWEDAETVVPDPKKMPKVHVTLRLDALLYRAILAYKRRAGIRSTTNAIEQLITRGLEQGEVGSDIGFLKSSLELVIAHQEHLDKEFRKAATGSVARKTSPTASLKTLAKNLVDHDKALSQAASLLKGNTSETGTGRNLSRR
ncbi:MAG: hypothetical protein ABSE64_06005 [Vulcanimicrobiaceae bacterium]|jgi:hypothetical protein